MIKIRFMILLIPILGMLAGGGVVWESLSPETRSGIAGGWVKYVLGGAIGLPVVFGIVWVSQVGRRAKSSGYVKPKVTGARVGDGVGELTVSAGHSNDVLSLRLPVGSKISTIERGHSYRVELSSSRRSVVEAIARENGYSGKVG